MLNHHEFYLDNIIKVKLPAEYKNETIQAEITVKTNNSETEPYVFSQELKFNNILKALIPSSLIKDGVKLNTFSYEIYAKEGSPFFIPIT